MNLAKFNTLIDLLTYFKDEQVCREHLEVSRWGVNLTCPYKDCLHNKVFKYTDGKRYKCAKCERQYSVRVGTIFEDSKIPLSKWFAAIYLITSHKKGISSIQLHKDIGVTQKSAWFMLHRIRHGLGLNTGSEKLTGTIEADETFMGGKERNKHKSKRTGNTQGRTVVNKTPVIGVMQRNGEFRAEVSKDTSSKSIRPFIVGNVEFGANLKTDEWLGYTGLSGMFKHKRINHSADEYVHGDTHTNTIEGAWSLLKRSVYGIYHSVSVKHLQPYVDESAFRYNTRSMSEAGRLNHFLTICNSHITYKDLIQSNDTDTTFISPYNQAGTQQDLFS
jgi:transposase-like protein